MLKNYFNIAWRIIVRNKVNSFLNIAGLAIGMASVLLIVMYIRDELQYDRFFKDADRIFQVNYAGNENGIDFLTGNTAPAVGLALVKEFPEVASCIRVHRPSDRMVRYEEGKQTPVYFTEQRVMAVDSNFLEVFNYAMLEGDRATCLQKPNDLVITESIAKKYFGDQPPLGKILLFDHDKIPFRVTGVLHNIPSQSSFQFNMLASISSYPEVKRRSWNWGWLQVNTYVKLSGQTVLDKTSIQKLESRFPAMVKRVAPDFVKDGSKHEYHLQPLTSVHLYSTALGTEARLTTLGNIKYIYIFSAIALFMMILACVNFMNLSTAQSAKRAKEVGIRKVLGSLRSQLTRQFLAEALLYSVIATVLALAIVMLLLNSFNIVSGKSFDYHALFNAPMLFFVAGLSLITGLLAGSYPALYLTSFNPVTVLKGGKLFKSGLGNLFIRNGLVVFQFTISITLIICTIIVFRQLQYTQSKDLGFKKENVVVIANSNRLGNAEEGFRQELTQMPGVIDAAIASCIPVRENFEDSYKPEPGLAGEQLVKEISLPSYVVDDHFIPTLQIQVLQGRNFSKDFTDSASVILNETAAKQVGWKNPVGMYLQYPGNDQRFKVIAVVKDFNIGSLYNRIDPFALFHSSSKTYSLGYTYTMVRMKPGPISPQLAQFEHKWKNFAVDIPFDYSFLDSELEGLYRSEQRMGTVFGIFTSLSIFIACLGLFGLAAYTAERRTKEIGVRKVLGASVQGLVVLLSKDFLRLVVFSAAISFPLAWWAMGKWLNDFAYQVEIGREPFIIAGLAASLIALVTVSFQAIKAALANPVKSLRTE